MKLKKLEISGFKSFGDKSVIKFPPGVSAIVGPNGCGKSNIVDALRWVMGEQSVKQLRGKSMEDVIFAGSNGRPALNLAEVSLVLSNDNGSAPPELKDFSEIMITRRLYRSGESAYFINKQSCRLKDIHNIFLGSGMGAKSYAVIQQGNIGAIIDAGPEERRVFIEEAAGVTRYKTQKAEALRKIESTRQNLVRLSDILSEVERQIESLQRQAQKAEEYKNLQQKIRKLDASLALRRHDQITAQINETDRLLLSLRDEDIAHGSRIKQLDASIEKVKIDRALKGRELSENKTKKFEVQRSIDKIENDLSHFHQDIERLGNEILTLESAQRELGQKNETISVEIAEVESLNQNLNREVSELSGALAIEKTESEKVRDRFRTLGRELEQSKASLLDFVSQETRIKNTFQNSANNSENLKRRLKRIDEEEAVAIQKKGVHETAERAARERLEAIKKEMAALNAHVEDARKKVDESGRALGNRVKQVQNLEMDLNRLKPKYLTLKKMRDNFEWYKEGVKAVMKQFQPSPDDRRIFGLIADILDPEPSFETALEAALGEALQYVVAKDFKTAQDVIQYLKTHNAGRCGIIPLSELGEGDRHGIVEDASDFKDPLLDHVTVKPGFEHVAEALLGHVFIDASEGNSSSFRNEAQHTRVTKSGELINRSAIVGGSTQNLSGILEKKQEIKRLEAQINVIEQQLEAAAKSQADLEKEVRKLESELQRAIGRKSEAEQAEKDGIKAFYKATEELNQSIRHLSIIHLEQEQLFGEESEIEEEIGRHKTLLEQFTLRVKSEESRVNEISEKMKRVSDNLEVFNQRIMELKLKSTALNVQLENNTNSLRRLKAYREDELRRSGKLSEEIDQKIRKKKDMEDRKLAQGRTLSTLYEALKEIDDALEKNEADFLRIERLFQEHDQAISESKGKMEELSRKIGFLEIEQTEHRLKRENIAARLEETYQASIAQFRAELPSDEISKYSLEEMDERLARLRKRILNFGDVNLGAIREFEQSKDRHEFLIKQREDLDKAIEDLHKVIRKINKITQERFIETFNLVNEKLIEVFPKLFNGGSAKLILTQPDRPLETGIEYMIHPPGKKLTRMSLLSGGEKALSAIAFIFSIFFIKPTSFCLLDEIDAPLDDANVFRFNDLLKTIGEKSQIVMITHNKRSMEFADTLFGVTMEQKGASKIVSVNLINSPENSIQ